MVLVSWPGMIAGCQVSWLTIAEDKISMSLCARGQDLGPIKQVVVLVK